MLYWAYRGLNIGVTLRNYTATVSVLFKSVLYIAIKQKMHAFDNFLDNNCFASEV